MCILPYFVYRRNFNWPHECAYRVHYIMILERGDQGFPSLVKYLLPRRTSEDCDKIPVQDKIAIQDLFYTQ